jgi:hypothetical protein
MADTVIQEREFVKMGNFIPKIVESSGSYRDIHSLRITLGGPARSISSNRKSSARVPWNMLEQSAWSGCADIDDLDHLGEKNRAPTASRPN